MLTESWRAALASSQLLVVSTLAGLLVGLVLTRVVYRRRVESLTVANGNLEARLEAARTVSPSEPVTRSRLTAGDVATVLTALAGIITAAGVVYINSQKTTIERQQANLKELDAYKKELEAERDGLARIAGFPLKEWTRVHALRPVAPAGGADRLLDEVHTSGSCNFTKVTWTYKGIDPAVLECGSGAFVLKGMLRDGGRLLVTKAAAP